MKLCTRIIFFDNILQKCVHKELGLSLMRKKDDLTPSTGFSFFGLFVMIKKEVLQKDTFKQALIVVFSSSVGSLLQAKQSMRSVRM